MVSQYTYETYEGLDPYYGYAEGLERLERAAGFMAARGIYAISFRSERGGRRFEGVSFRCDDRRVYDLAIADGVALDLDTANTRRQRNRLGIAAEFIAEVVRPVQAVVLGADNWSIEWQRDVFGTLPCVAETASFVESAA